MSQKGENQEILIINMVDTLLLTTDSDQRRLRKFGFKLMSSKCFHTVHCIYIKCYNFVMSYRAFFAFEMSRILKWLHAEVILPTILLFILCNILQKRVFFSLDKLFLLRN